ncbi:MAG: phospho-N-acetylmuramoyl-pentapeptide-transferase [Campylobacterota bacterium]
MLYWFYRHLDINIFQYITVRASIGFFIAFVLALYLIPKYKKWAKAKKANQPINKYVPAHQFKSDTPTMGGAVFIFSALIGVILSAKLNNYFIIGGLITVVGTALVGFKDDIAKVVSKDNLSGLSAKGKLLLQVIVAAAASGYLLFYAGFSSELYVPFYKHAVLDLGIFAWAFWTLVIVAASNAVNLTDGLDGLATVPSILSIATLGIILYITGHAVISQYLLMPSIQGAGEVAIFAAAMAGSLLAFLWYNCHPAELFMGDTGSLSVGAFLGYMAIIGKSEILLILIGFIFVIETISVILQVGSFKLRKKRVFLKAPIHHHFEEKKWAENKIIVRFWIIALLSNALALISLKIR